MDHVLIDSIILDCLACKQYQKILDLLKPMQKENASPEKDVPISEVFNGLENESAENEKTEWECAPRKVSKLLLLEAYCELKIGNFSQAASLLDQIPDLPDVQSKSFDWEQHFNMDWSEFLMHALASIFPICWFRSRSRASQQYLDHQVTQPEASLLSRLFDLFHFGKAMKTIETSREKHTANHQEMSVWSKRFDVGLRCLLNGLLVLGHYECAFSLIQEEVLYDYPESASGLYLMCYICLVTGLSEAAEYHLGITECLYEIPELKTLTSVTNGILKLLNDSLTSSTKEMQEAKELCRKLDGSESMSYLAAVNNFAVALLYEGKVPEATRVCEELLFFSRKPRPLEALLKTLCLLYEFATNKSEKIFALKKFLKDVEASDADITQLVKSWAQ